MSFKDISGTCSHIDGKGRVCGGELTFSHDIADEDRTSVFICKKCGERTEVT